MVSFKEFSFDPWAKTLLDLSPSFKRGLLCFVVVATADVVEVVVTVAAVERRMSEMVVASVGSLVASVSVASVEAVGVVVVANVVVVVGVVVSCRSLSKISMTDSVLVEILWLTPDKVSLGGSSWR